MRKFPGIATTDAGVFWTDVASHNGWRVQYNKTLDKASPLSPYRLLDPESNLWASANEAGDLKSGLSGIVAEFEKRQPLLTREDAKKLLEALGALIVTVATKGKQAKLPA